MRYLIEKFKMLSNAAKLTVFSIICVSSLMILMTLGAVTENKKMYASFIKDMVALIADDMTKEIESVLNKTIEPITTFDEYDNTTSKLSKSAKDEMYIDYLSRSIKQTQKDMDCEYFF